MKLLTLALAAFLMVVYPFLLPWPDKALARIGIDLPVLFAVSSVGTAMLIRATLLLAICIGAAMGLLLSLHVKQYATHLIRHRKWLRIGLGGVVTYLILAVLAMVLGAIPYGGPIRIPAGLHLLLFVSWLALAIGLYRTIAQELPALRRQPQLNEAAEGAPDKRGIGGS